MINQYHNTIPRNKFQYANTVATCDEKTLRLLRQTLAEELTAINDYEQRITETSNEMTKTVLKSIANEERMHTGEILALIDSLCPDEANLRARGREEVSPTNGQ